MKKKAALYDFLDILSPKFGVDYNVDNIYLFYIQLLSFSILQKIIVCH